LSQLAKAEEYEQVRIIAENYAVSLERKLFCLTFRKNTIALTLNFLGVQTIIRECRY